MGQGYFKTSVATRVLGFKISGSTISRKAFRFSPFFQLLGLRVTGLMGLASVCRAFGGFRFKTPSRSLGALAEGALTLQALNRES